MVCHLEFVSREIIPVEFVQRTATLEAMVKQDLIYVFMCWIQYVLEKESLINKKLVINKFI